MTNEHREPDRSTINIPLSEELLEARVIESEIGKVRFHKRIETGQVQDEIELHHDDVTVERLARNEIVAERREPWDDGDALMIPVYEEVLVTEKRLVLCEVIRVRQASRTERVPVEGEVRREVVDIERSGE